MKVTVADGIRVVHEGKAYRGGESADVPDEVAKSWIESGWASEEKAETKSSSAAKAAPKTK
jgi:hypothetical protein